MAASRVNTSFFTVERSVKQYVYAQGVIQAFAEFTQSGGDAKQFDWPQLPATDGVLQNGFAFPYLIEVDEEGKQAPATAETWTAHLTNRLVTGGLEASSSEGIGTPSLAYNQQLLTYHFEHLQSARQENEFVGYLRALLLGESGRLRQDGQTDKAQLLSETLGWLEVFNLQYKAKRLSQGKNKKKRATLRIKMLAYKILFVYDQIPLQNKNDIEQQVAYIHDVLGTDTTEIKRYLTSNVSGIKNKTYVIYNEDSFEDALYYISEIMPDAPVDSFQFREVNKK